MKIVLTILISLFIFTGCIPKFEKTEKIDNKKVANELKLDLSTFNSSNLAIQKNWWENFNDKQLNNLINEALKNTPSLNILKLRYKSAKSKIEINKSLKKPSLNLNSTNSRQRFSENYIFPDPLGGNYYNLYDQGLNLSYDFDFWDKNSSLIEASINESLARKLYIQVKEISLITTITKLYTTLNYNKRELEELEKLEDVINEKHHILNTLHNLGLANQIEINKSSTSLEKIRHESLNKKLEIEEIKKTLSTISGIMLSKIDKLELNSNFDNYDIYIPKEINLDILSHRPEIAMQKYLIKSKNNYIQNAQAQYYPNISLSGLINFTSFSWASLFNNTSFAPFLGSAISLPLFDGGKRDNNLEMKVDEYNIEIENYNQSVVDAVNDVVSSLRKLELNKSKLKVQENILESREKNLEIEKKIFELGLKNKISYLDSIINLHNEKFTKLTLTNNEINAHINLIKALGGGYKEKGTSVDNN